MKRNESERGAVLLWVMALIVISGILLNVMAVHAGRASRGSRHQTDEEAALLEARGGVRWMAARLGEQTEAAPLSRVDPDGELRVSVEGDRIRSTYRWSNRVACTVTARWRRAAAIELSDWRQEE